MSFLPKDKRNKVVVTVQLGMCQTEVAVKFGVSRITMTRLMSCVNM